MDGFHPHCRRRWSGRVARFNEAIDEALTDSLKVFVEDADHRRRLFGDPGSRFARTVASIISCAQLAMRKHPKAVREAGIVLRSAARVKALADDLLEFTMHGLKLGAPKALSAMRLDQFCQQTLDEINVLTPGWRVDFQREEETSGMWDGRRLHQLLWNLIVNALKYGAADQPVTLVLDRTHNVEIRLIIHNFGTPIPPQILPTLFAPLVRGSPEHVPSPLQAGANMGLGLYIIANTITEAHGGKISVTSSTTEGTQFKVVLPRWSQEANVFKLAERV